MIDLPPTFGMYKWEADVLGAGYIPVPRRRDFSVDIDAVEGTVRALEASGAPPKLLFVTNPNNPDGSVTPRAGPAAAARPAGRGRGGRGLHRLQRRSRAWRRSCPSATT